METYRDTRIKGVAVVRDFVEGAKSGDIDRMRRAIENLDYVLWGGGWRRAFLELSRQDSIPDTTREFFLRVYLDFGDHIRQETGNDLILARGLRALLPRYDGGPVQLYRGESFFNRKLRTYGLAWSSSQEVARSFAEIGFQRLCEGGSVLLSTLAPASAIICAPAELSDQYREQEFLVDRRRLDAVRVEERFAQILPEEHRLLGSGAGALTEPHLT